MDFKEKYGEVITPDHLIEEIFLYLEKLLYNYKKIDLYEVGYGKGNFYNKYNLKFKTNYEGCEINDEYILPKNIQKGDFLDININYYDVILGNLPFNSGGLLNVPCRKIHSKGTSIWKPILKKCVEHIKDEGYGCFIIPCIWLKPDKDHIYDLLTQYEIKYLKIYNSTESNKFFNYECQTPICYIIFKKKINISGLINIYDKNIKDFIEFNHEKNKCIPTDNIELIHKCQLFIRDRPYIKTLEPIKISCTKKTILPCDDKDCNFVITTSILNEDKTKLCHKGFYSKTNAPYYGVEKVMLTHKRLPIAEHDSKGIYGLYGRDKYVILGENCNYVTKYINSKKIQKIIKSFCVRMNFYEKHIFEYIPDPRTFKDNDYDLFLSL